LLEALEARLPLAVATDLAEISGRVFVDQTGNGFTPGEQVAGATVNLYRDDGDGLFESSSGDTLSRTVVTADTGIYRFSGLTTGDYFVQQPAQTISGRTLAAQVSTLVRISSTDVNGRVITTIDPFDQTQQKVTDEVNDGIPVTSSIAAPEVIGGERDLFVNKTSVNGSVQLSVNDPLLPGILSFDSILTGQGERRVSWDGIDGDATRIRDSGLNNRDLTSAGAASGLQLQIGADLSGGQVTLRAYSDDGNASTASRFSTATLTLPATGGLATSFEFIPFSQFTAASGGAADFTRVGAIELEVTGVANVNGTVDLVGAVGATVFSRDFDNFDPADLSLTKTVDVARPSIGQDVQFILTLANAGPETATNIRVRDVLPSGLLFVSSTASVGGYDDATGLWTVSSLNSGANATLQLTARVNAAGTWTNVAEVTAVDQADPDSIPNNANPEEDDRATVAVVAEAIDLSLTKTVNVPSVIVGQQVTFTVNVTNGGPSNATGVSVRDQLPTGVSFISASASQGSYNAATGIWTVGAIAANATRTLTLIGRVDSAGSKNNQAEVVSADQKDVDSTPGNGVAGEDDQASVSFDSPQVDLSVTKTVSNANPNVGDNVVFTVTVSNAGPNNATTVRVRDQLPPGLTFVSSNPSQGTFDQSTGTWTVGTLNVSSSATLGLTARATAAGTLTNTAEVLSVDQPDVDSTPNNGAAGEDDIASATVNAQQIDLSLNKTVDIARPNIGDTIVFTVRVANAGPSTATGVVVRDKLPDGFSFVSASPSVGSYDASNGNWNVGTINAGANQTLLLTAKLDASTSVVNTAEVIAANQPDVDSTPGNGVATEDDQSSLSLTAQTADLSVTKTVVDASPNVGQQVVFNLTVRNAGPDAATGVEVTDRLPNGISFVSAAPSQGTYDTATGRWVVGSLNSSIQATMQLIGRIDVPGAKTNTAELTAADQFDPDSTPGNGQATEDDQASVTVTPPTVDLSLEKTVANPRPNPGSVVRFTLQVANAGPSNASGIVIRDTLPAGLAFVSASPSIGQFDAATGQWTIPALASGASATLALDARLNATTTVTNVAELIAADQFDVDSTPGNGNPIEDDYDTVSVTPASADLSVTKTVDNSTPNVGTDVTFTVTLANSGPDQATGVQIRDLLPAGVSFISSSPQQGTYSPTSGIWDVGTLAVNGSTKLAIVGRPTTAGELTNTAEVFVSDQLDRDSTPNNQNPNEDDQASVSIRPQLIDLSLVKTVDDDRPNVGQDITFTIVVSNAGPSMATGVSVSDQFPQGLLLRSHTPSQGSFNPDTGLWVIGNIAAGASVSLQLVGRVEAIVDGANIAQVLTANQPDIDSIPGNDAVTEDDYDAAPFSTLSADLSLTKLVDNARPNVGERISFLVRLNNTGPDAANGVSVRDELSKGLTLVSVTPSQGTFDSATGVWTVGQVLSQQQATLLLVADVTSSAAQFNQAEVLAVQEADPDSTPGDRNPEEDDFARVAVTPQIADLNIALTTSTRRPSLGQTFTYTAVLTNSGPDAATAIGVQGSLPSGLSFVSATTTLGTFDPRTGIWTIPQLSALQSATLEAQVMVDAPGTYTTRAQLIAVDQFDPDSKPNNDDGIDGNANDEDDQAAVTVVVASADLSLTKTVSDPLPGLGTQVSFALKLNNNGPDPARSVVVRDLLPAGLEFVSSTATAGSYDAPSGRWSIVQIDPRRTETLTIVARVDTLGVKTNVTEIIASSEFDPDSTPGNGNTNEDDQSSVAIDPQLVDLAITKVINDPLPNVGDTIRYTLNLTNDGPSTATQIQVRDRLPPNLTYKKFTASTGIYDPASGIWSVSSLLADGSAELVIEAVVGKTFGETNTAEVIAVRQPDFDSTPANGNVNEDDIASVTFATRTADLSLTTSVNNSSPSRNEVILLSVTLTNSGKNEGTGVVVSNPLSNPLQFVSYSATAGSYNPQTGQWSIDSVAAGGVEQLQIYARVVGKNPFVSRAEVVRSRQLDPDSTPGNGLTTEDDYAQVSVAPPQVDLSVTGSTTNAELRPGSVIQINFTVNNAGPSDATGVRLRGAVPPGLTFISAIPQRGVVNLSTGTWDVGNVARGETLSLVLTARVDTRNDKLAPFEVIACDQFDVDSTPANGLLGEDDQVLVLVRVPPFSKRLFLS